MDGCEHLPERVRLVRRVRGVEPVLLAVGVAVGLVHEHPVAVRDEDDAAEPVGVGRCLHLLANDLGDPVVAQRAGRPRLRRAAHARLLERHHRHTGDAGAVARHGLELHGEPPLPVPRLGHHAERAAGHHGALQAQPAALGVQLDEHPGHLLGAPAAHIAAKVLGDEPGDGRGVAGVDRVEEALTEPADRAVGKCDRRAGRTGGGDGGLGGGDGRDRGREGEGQKVWSHGRA